MNVSLVAGQANPRLAEAIAGDLGVELTHRIVERFPDSETHVELMESVRGKDVYLLQPTAPPVNEHLVELTLLADACRRDGAARITAVVPYFGYARQDRRAKGLEAIAGRLSADLIAASGVQRLVVVDLHTASVEGFFDVPVEHLSAAPLLVRRLRSHVENGVVVAADLGAVKLAERYATALSLPMAVVHKLRLGPESVKAMGIVGDVAGRTPIIVDDMIGTGATIEVAACALGAARSNPGAIVAASHLLLVGAAVERLAALRLERLVGTDSVPVATGLPLPLEVVSLGRMLAEAIGRLTRDEPLGDLAWHG